LSFQDKRKKAANTNTCILLDKPAGVTSFGALKKVKDRMGISRVGHAGTLDSFARGLLIVCTGKYTRLAGLFTALPKEYVATFLFGTTTDTLDPVGTVTETGTVPTGEELAAALSSFRGEISQRPPEYSAVHINGKRAYKYAREGQKVLPAPRNVVIYSLEMESCNPPFATFRVGCSKGTYIRSLARDIAAAVGTVAHVTQLCRTRIGGFTIEEAVGPDQFDPGRHCRKPMEFMGKLPEISILRAEADLCRHCVFGKDLRLTQFACLFAEGSNAVLNEKGDLVAMVERKHDDFIYRMVVGEA